MRERSFDEMIAYFNRRVSEMDIAQDYKMELLGMVAALEYKHEKTAQQWIPCSERLPKPFEFCLWTTTDGRVVYHHCDGMFSEYTAWMPLPEPYKGE